jgi:hypothetical protein
MDARPALLRFASVLMARSSSQGAFVMKHKSLIAFLVLVTLGNLGTVLVMMIVVALLYATGQLRIFKTLVPDREPVKE